MPGFNNANELMNIKKQPNKKLYSELMKWKTQYTLQDLC